MASVAGRFYAMDRDKRWDRIERAYEIVAGSGEARAADPVAYIREQYAEGVTDEFLPPVSICAEGEAPVRIGDGDAVIFFNFRPDRAREMTHALLDRDFPHFERSRVPHDLTYVTMTEYEEGLPVRVAFPPEAIRNCLAEVVSRSGGLRSSTSPRPRSTPTSPTSSTAAASRPSPARTACSSPRARTCPPTTCSRQMSAARGHRRRRRAHRHGRVDLIIVNYANADMVGHTGDFAATVQACEVVDGCLGRVVDAALAAGGALLITADHGNAEHMIDAATGSRSPPTPPTRCRWS